MVKQLPAFFLAMTLAGCAHQTSLELQLRRFEAPLITTSPDGAQAAAGSVVYYLGTKPRTPPHGAALLYLRGTGAEPATADFGKAAEASLFGYDIVYPEKRFVGDPATYARTDCREKRLAEASAVLDATTGRGTDRVLLFAESEATMFAPELAKRYGSKTVGLVCVAGTVTPFAEDLLFAAAHPSRHWAPPPLRAPDLMAEFDRIRKNPTDTEKTFWGHSYRFWSSYLDVDPTAFLTGARYPVLYVIGEYDGVDLEKQASVVARLRSQGADVELVVLKGVGHRMEEAHRELANTILDWARRKKVVD